MKGIKKTTLSDKTKQQKNTKLNGPLTCKEISEIYRIENMIKAQE